LKEKHPKEKGMDDSTVDAMKTKTVKTTDMESGTTTRANKPATMTTVNATEAPYRRLRNGSETPATTAARSYPDCLQVL
jgi:hypothetical protein